MRKALKAIICCLLLLITYLKVWGDLNYIYVKRFEILAPCSLGNLAFGG